MGITLSFKLYIQLLVLTALQFDLVVLSENING